MFVLCAVPTGCEPSLISRDGCPRGRPGKNIIVNPRPKRRAGKRKGKNATERFGADRGSEEETGQTYGLYFEIFKEDHADQKTRGGSACPAGVPGCCPVLVYKGVCYAGRKTAPWVVGGGDEIAVRGVDIRWGRDHSWRWPVDAEFLTPEMKPKVFNRHLPGAESGGRLPVAAVAPSSIIFLFSEMEVQRKTRTTKKEKGWQRNEHELRRFAGTGILRMACAAKGMHR